LLAGFLEIGETFEMAVVREVREESGINVDISSVRYDCAPIFPPPSLKEPSLSADASKFFFLYEFPFPTPLHISAKCFVPCLLFCSYAACQPWPFPSSLMVGFTAEAIKNQTEPYHGISGKGNPGISRSETLTVVDEANALPRTAADMKELEVNNLEGPNYCTHNLHCGCS
jgi:hypothetical protein